MKLSIVIPARDNNDPKLAELLRSIEAQDFPKSDMEVLVITEGTSESAKAIGIRKAKGEVIGILASDNELVEKNFLTKAVTPLLEQEFTCSYPAFYHYEKKDNILNRYFSLIGANDPLAIYMGKKDRASYRNINFLPPNLCLCKSPFPTIGDNGFFVRKSIATKQFGFMGDDDYYHVDSMYDVRIFLLPAVFVGSIWHKTGGNLLSFFRKRYRYGLQHAFNKNRRWHLVDFRQPKDIVRLIWFIFTSMTLLQPLSLSIRGYLKIRDMAWFLHPMVCLMTVFTYGVLVLHLTIRKLFQSLSAPTAVQKA